MKPLFPILAAGAIAAACSGNKATTSPHHLDAIASATIGSTSSPNMARPAAVVYRTARDYTNNVPVTMNANRTRITSFPDPADLRNAEQKPLPLGHGYLLDRRGIGPRTAYLDITIDEYSRISSAPAPAELLRRIAVRSPFAEMYSLPITAAEAVRDTAACNAYIAGGFDGCKNLLGGKPAPRAITVGGARVE